MSPTPEWLKTLLEYITWDNAAQVCSLAVVAITLFINFCYREKLYLFERVSLFLVCISFLAVFIVTFMGIETPPWVRFGIRAAFFMSSLDLIRRLRRRPVPKPPL